MKRYFLITGLISFSLMTNLAVAQTQSSEQNTAQPRLIKSHPMTQDTAKFDKLDLNKNGFITKAELTGWSETRKKAFFKHYDANHDGKVSRVEFLTAGPLESTSHQGKRTPILNK